MLTRGKREKVTNYDRELAAFLAAVYFLHSATFPLSTTSFLSPTRREPALKLVSSVDVEKCNRQEQV